MNRILTRTVALLAALLLAGASIGCEREVGEEEGVGVGEEEGVGLGEEEGVGVGEEEGVGLGEEEQAGLGEEEGVGLGDEEFFEDMDMESAAEELAEGLRGEESLEETRGDVADELDVPEEMVTFTPEVRQAIIDAETDWEAHSWARVGLAEGMMGRLNQDELEGEDVQIYTNVQNRIGTTKGYLEQMGAETEQEYEQLKTQIGSELEEIERDFGQFTDDLQQEAPAGGGPME